MLVGSVGGEVGGYGRVVVKLIPVGVRLRGWLSRPPGIVGRKNRGSELQLPTRDVVPGGRAPPGRRVPNPHIPILT